MPNKKYNEKRECEMCGKLFIPNTSHQIFCSVRCGKLYHRHKIKTRKQLKSITRRCFKCGTEFKVIPFKANYYLCPRCRASNKEFFYDTYNVNL